MFRNCTAVSITLECFKYFFWKGLKKNKDGEQAYITFRMFLVKDIVFFLSAHVPGFDFGDTQARSDKEVHPQERPVSFHSVTHRPVVSILLDIRDISIEISIHCFCLKKPRNKNNIKEWKDFPWCVSLQVWSERQSYIAWVHTYQPQSGLVSTVSSKRSIVLLHMSNIIFRILRG